MKTAARNRKHGRSVYSPGKRNVFWLHLIESREGFCPRGRGRSLHVDGPKTKKSREPKVESLVRGIWKLRVSKAERRAWEGVKLKTVTEIRRSSARKTFIAESVYLVLNFLWDWEIAVRSKERSDVASFTCVLFVCCCFQYETSSTVLNATRKQADQKGENYSSRGVTE